MILDIRITIPEEPGDNAPIEVLQEQIDHLSKAKKRKHTDFHLYASLLDATPQFVRLLIELLNIPLPPKIDGSATKWT